MSNHDAPISAIGRVLAAIIAAVVILIGAYIFTSGHAPGMFTRFGYTPALYGVEAKKFGVIHMALGLLPIIVFCRNARQATIAGSMIGAFIIAVIFYTTYA